MLKTGGNSRFNDPQIFHTLKATMKPIVVANILEIMRLSRDKKDSTLKHSKG
jgi:hypothetical protein